MPKIKNGFTLLELAIIIALLAVTNNVILGLYQFILQDERAESLKYLINAELDIINFYKVNNYLPCPQNINCQDKNNRCKNYVGQYKNAIKYQILSQPSCREYDTDKIIFIISNNTQKISITKRQLLRRVKRHQYSEDCECNLDNLGNIIASDSKIICNL
jgi:Tfp pilus assembly protein FimT